MTFVILEVVGSWEEIFRFWQVGWQLAVRFWQVAVRFWQEVELRLRWLSKLEALVWIRATFLMQVQLQLIYTLPHRQLGCTKAVLYHNSLSLQTHVRLMILLIQNSFTLEPLIQVPQRHWLFGKLFLLHVKVSLLLLFQYSFFEAFHSHFKYKSVRYKFKCHIITSIWSDSLLAHYN